jgi:hypothetical protein
MGGRDPRGLFLFTTPNTKDVSDSLARNNPLATTPITVAITDPKFHFMMMVLIVEQRVIK